MDCKRIQQYLNDYRTGQLDAELHEMIDRHLAECAACRAELDSMQSVSEFLKNADSPESIESLAPLILQKLSHMDREDDSRQTTSLHAIPARLKWILGVSFLCAFILVGMLVFKFRRDEPNYFMSYGQAGYTWMDVSPEDHLILEEIQRMDQLSGSIGTGGSISALTGADTDHSETEGRVIHTFDLSD